MLRLGAELVENIMVGLLDLVGFVSLLSSSSRSCRMSFGNRASRAMLFKDSRSSTHSVAVPGPGWDVCFYPSCEKCVFSVPFLHRSVYMISGVQEYPDRMLATFSVLPSPKVSETVVEVCYVNSCGETACCGIHLSFLSLTTHCSPFISSLRTVT
jgi:hypothetical protein